MGRSQELLDAAREGDKRTVEKIIGQITKRSGPFTSLRRGAGVNVQDDSGYTPLHHACLRGHKEIVHLLLSVDASPCIVDKMGATPLHLAAWKGDSNIVAMLLAHNNPPVNIDHLTLKQETALLIAAQSGYVEVVAQLLAKGADVNVKNMKHETSLDLAAQYGRTETVKHLIRARPQLLEPYKLPKCKGREFPSTPLHRASKSGHREIVTALIEAGVDPNVRTTTGATPLHEAACYGKAIVVQILLEKGANLNAVDRRGKTVHDLLADYSEEATRRVKKVIQEYESMSRSTYESEDDLPPFPVQDSSPTSYPIGAGKSRQFPEALPIKLPSIINKKASSTNLKSSDTDVDVANAEQLELSKLPPSKSYPKLSQMVPIITCDANLSDKCENQFNVKSVDMNSEAIYVNRLDLGNETPISEVNSEYFNVYDNVPPVTSTDTLKSKTICRTRKNTPFLDELRVILKQISPKQDVTDMKVNPTEKDFVDSIQIESHDEHTDPVYINVVENKDDSECVGYVIMHGQKPNEHRKSFSDFVSYKPATSSAHLKGDSCCVYGSLDYLYDYQINPNTLRGNDFPFIRKKLIAKWLPCNCNGSNRRRDVVSDVYYSTFSLHCYSSNIHKENADENDEAVNQKYSTLQFTPFNEICTNISNDMILMRHSQ